MNLSAIRGPQKRNYLVSAILTLMQNKNQPLLSRRVRLNHLLLMSAAARAKMRRRHCDHALLDQRLKATNGTFDRGWTRALVKLLALNLRANLFLDRPRALRPRVPESLLPLGQDRQRRGHPCLFRRRRQLQRPLQRPSPSADDLVTYCVDGSRNVQVTDASLGARKAPDAGDACAAAQLEAACEEGPRTVSIGKTG